MVPLPNDEEIADLIQSMNRGQYAVLVMALRAAGGELRVDPAELVRIAGDRPRLDVDATDGPVVLRLL